MGLMQRLTFVFVFIFGFGAQTISSITKETPKQLILYKLDQFISIHKKSLAELQLFESEGFAIFSTNSNKRRLEKKSKAHLALVQKLRKIANNTDADNFVEVYAPLMFSECNKAESEFFKYCTEDFLPELGPNALGYYSEVIRRLNSSKKRDMLLVVGKIANLKGFGIAHEYIHDHAKDVQMAAIFAMGKSDGLRAIEPFNSLLNENLSTDMIEHILRQLKSIDEKVYHKKLLFFCCQKDFGSTRNM
jgi:hypothetical protein